MEWYWLFLMMVVAHSIADFHLQGCLADLKMQDWWKQDRRFRKKYENDYIPPLILHALEWSFIVHIPAIWVYGFDPTIFLFILLNAGIHAYVDNLKCNEMEINLVQDQECHIMQIFVTSFILYVI